MHPPPTFKKKKKNKPQNTHTQVNNAGITKDGLVMTMKPEAWQAVIDINLSGVFYASKAAAGQL
jgi:NAD(P)-dependent dehydrogenase (short-subunit alcohol dehydrogenase family)